MLADQCIFTPPVEAGNFENLFLKKWEIWGAFLIFLQKVEGIDGIDRIYRSFYHKSWELWGVRGKIFSLKFS
jgi:hypothetical protein